MSSPSPKQPNPEQPSPKQSTDSAGTRPSEASSSAQPKSDSPQADDAKTGPRDTSKTPRDASPPQRTTAKKAARRSRLPVVLLVLLLVSVAYNVAQWRQRATLETRASELESALDNAVETLDAQTARAVDAESTLSDVDSAMQTVRERIASLQGALDQLEAATE